VTGEAAEGLKRRWIGIEINHEYVRGSRIRFQSHTGRRSRRAGAEQVPLDTRPRLCYTPPACRPGG
jgi:DNA modification methylase